MPKTLNGIGTRFYGKQDFESDGSYVTTKFFVMFLFPILPLQSYRVLQKEERSFNWLLMTESQEYSIKKVPLNIKQIVKVYFIGFLIIFSIFLALHILGAF